MAAASNPQRYALLSVSDKQGLVPLAEAILASGRAIVSTGGTLRHLQGAGIEAVSVSSLTASPEILGGRVKTLHPVLHGGLLYRRDLTDHVEQAAAHGLPAIDIAVINLYPFEATIAQEGVTDEDAIEQIDIGGPAMVRASAKNHQAVAIVTDPAQYEDVIAALRATGEIPLATRRSLAAAAFTRTALYDATISSWMRRSSDESESGLPASQPLPLLKTMDVRYGENPQQQAALYHRASDPVLGGAEVLQGKELSYNNLLDADAAIGAVLEHDEPAVVVVKHTNPCGVGRSESSLLEAWKRAREADPVSAFGGIVATNRVIDAATAEELASLFLEVVTAPGYTEEAREILACKSRLRLLAWPAAGFQRRPQLRDTLLGTLVQELDPRITDEECVGRVVSERQPTEDERAAMRFLWRVCKHVRSNAIVIGGPERTFGIGAGQMSRVDAVGLAITKATGDLQGSVLASDAFFPFADGLQRAIDVGVSAVIQPGGSVRDDEVIDAANAAGIAMVMTGIRHFRH